MRRQEHTLASTHSKHQVEQVYRTATPDYTTRRLVTGRHSIVITTPLQKTSECHYGDEFTFAQPELRAKCRVCLHLPTTANTQEIALHRAPLNLGIVYWRPGFMASTKRFQIVFSGPFGGQPVGGSFPSQADLFMYMYTVRYAQNAPSSLML